MLARAKTAENLPRVENLRWNTYVRTVPSRRTSPTRFSSALRVSQKRIRRFIGTQVGFRSSSLREITSSVMSGILSQERDYHCRTAAFRLEVELREIVVDIVDG